MSLKEALEGKLNLATVDYQFCSDWLKQEMRAILQENARLREALRQALGHSNCYCAICKTIASGSWWPTDEQSPKTPAGPEVKG